MLALGDSPITKVGTGGSVKTAYATAVGFDPKLNASSLIINGQQVIAHVGNAKTSLTLERTITGASTLTLTVADPKRVLVNSPIASISAPPEPITVVSTNEKVQTSTVINPDGTVTTIVSTTTSTGTTTTTSTTSPRAPNSQLPYNTGYYPTVAAITDGTTTIPFALVSVGKDGDALTLTFEDQIVNQLRYCSDPSGYVATAGTMTRADVMAKVVQKAIAQLQGNVVVPQLIYPTAAEIQAVEGANPEVQVVDNLVWGSSQDPDQDAWSFLVQAANDAQWRCFSTGTALVFGPDAWLLTSPPAATFQEYQNGVGFINGEWDIGQVEATCTVTCFTGDPLTFCPGAVAAVANLGVFSGLWIVSDMKRELHLADCTVTLCQAQPALTEAQIAATGAVASVGTNAAGQALTTPTISSTTQSAIATKAVTFALAQVGKPYITGGTGPGGYDCSGLMFKAYLVGGLTIPRTSEEQAAAGYTAVTPTIANLEPGDLVFYRGDGTYPSPGHVVMYVGNGDCVEAEETGTNIMVIPLPGNPLSACRPAPGTNYNVMPS
jgi:cell wall-associated NlpC family hydrolase